MQTLKLKFLLKENYISDILITHFGIRQITSGKLLIIFYIFIFYIFIFYKKLIKIIIVFLKLIKNQF